jgi:hypothetical protein
LTHIKPFQQKSTYEPPGVSPDSDMTFTEKYFKSGDGSLLAVLLARSLSPIEMAESQYISVRSNTLLHPRTRSQWEALQSLQTHRSEWRIDSSSNIMQRDERRHAGNIDYNQGSRDKDSWPQSSIPKLTTYDIPSFHAYQSSSNRSDASDDSVESVYSDASAESEIDGRESLPIPMEVPARYQLGDVIANIMTCDQLPVLRFVLHDS